MDTVKYCIEYDMSYHVRLLPGQRVMHTMTRRHGVIISCMAVMVCFEPDIEANNYFKREDLKVVPVTVNHVPASLVCVSGKHPLIGNGGRRLSVNGLTDRLSLSVGSSVESKQPAVSSLDLQIGYSVDIVSDNGGELGTGRIVNVRHCEDKSLVLYDVHPDGYDRVNIAGSEEQRRKAILQRVTPELLMDRGSTKWILANKLDIIILRAAAINPHSDSGTDSTRPGHCWPWGKT
eukprot:scaffold66990_cov36-Attheya_sp.AAC.1